MGFIIKFVFHLLATATVFWLIENYVLPANFAVIGQSWQAYLVVACAFGLLNFWVKPLIKIAMLPLNILTLGFASLAVNGVLLFILQYGLTIYDVYGVGLSIEGVLSYVVAGFVLAIAHVVIHWIK